MLPFLIPLRVTHVPNQSKSQALVKAFICISDFTLVVGGFVGGFLDTVEVISPEPQSHEVPECLKTLGNFPTTIERAVGTTFGKLKGI